MQHVAEVVSFENMETNLGMYKALSNIKGEKDIWEFYILRSSALKAPRACKIQRLLSSGFTPL